MPFARRPSAMTPELVRAAMAAALIATLAAVPVLAPRAAAQERASSTSRTPGDSTALPESGEELIRRMHDRWATGEPWFHTLTFVQTTTLVRSDGTSSASTWYESLLAPDRLRIDFGDPAEGNGVLYTADSLYVVKKGKVTRKSGEGNPFLPFVLGAYTQPVDSTLSQLAPLGFDMSRVRRDRWRDRPVFVVGARDADDLSSAQFWVDAERLILLRMVLAPSGDASEGSRRPDPLDIHMDDYVEVGGGWLATKVAMYASGSARQTEDYSEWHAGVDLPRDLFVAEEWSNAEHWAKPRE